MVYPNFLIVGAAKSGTTSLFAYLEQHPDIYMPSCKEPHYFSDSHTMMARSDEEYEMLFDSRAAERAIGEASVSYLFDPTSPHRILETLGKVRIIIILRNPVDRAHSQWGHLHYLGFEELSFNEALQVEKTRMASDEFRNSSLAPHHGFYYYFHCGLYHDQVKRYLDVFGPDHVRVLIFEEFVRSPARGCREIFEFLGVDPDFQPELSRRNPSHTYKHRLLYNLISGRPGFLQTAYTKLPMQARIWVHKAVKPIYWLNMKPVERQRMDSSLRAELEDRYRDDVAKLEKLLGRDLDLWFGERQHRANSSANPGPLT